MSTQERDEWNQRYANGDYKSRQGPSPMLLDWLPSLPKGHALDIACGLGRHSLFLAQQGYAVDAIDVSAVALRQGQRKAEKMGLQVNWIEADLDTCTWAPESYDLIVNSFYINRNLIPQIKDGLKNGGLVLFEHHFLTDEPVEGPKNPNFRLRPNELLHLFLDLRILFYREGIVQEEDRTVAVSRLIAQKPSTK